MHKESGNFSGEYKDSSRSIKSNKKNKIRLQIQKDRKGGKRKNKESLGNVKNLMKVKIKLRQRESKEREKRVEKIW